MADDVTEEEDLTLEAPDAGWAFRAEMWIKDTLMGYWMYLVAVVAVFLAGIFIYQQVQSAASSQQRDASKQIAQVEKKLGVPAIDLEAQRASGQAVDEAASIEVAAALEAVDVGGAARADAMLKAAEIYRVLGKTEDQRRALQAVVDTGVDPVAGLATVHLAHVELDAGEADAAIARLQALAAGDGIVAQYASVDLGLAYEHLERTAEARALYQEHLTKWPASVFAREVKRRQSGLGEG